MTVLRFLNADIQQSKAKDWKLLRLMTPELVLSMMSKDTRSVRPEPTLQLSFISVGDKSSDELHKLVEPDMRAIFLQLAFVYGQNLVESEASWCISQLGEPILL